MHNNNNNNNKYLYSAFLLVLGTNDVHVTLSNDVHVVLKKHFFNIFSISEDSASELLENHEGMFLLY